MRPILLVLTGCLHLACAAQSAKQDSFSLAVSPAVDKSVKDNQAIIKTLTDFLRTKDSSLTKNRHWAKADFQKYTYPYFDIYNIEGSKYGNGFYKPTLMEILPAENPTQRVVKIAFIGHVAETGENQLKAIYNVVANVSQSGITFSRYLDYATQNWQTVSAGSLTYKISPSKKADQKEMADQQKDVGRLCVFFGCKPIPVTYYSCVNPKEVFEIKGFDYHPMMYAEKTGGLAEVGNLVFSGNNAETYTHEIVHVYTSNLFPQRNKFLDEGMATYAAGSGKFNYGWHRKKLAKFLSENPAYSFAEHLDPYERIYFEKETPITYVSAALILERTLRLYGKDKLIGLLKSETDLWTALQTVGLTKENIDEELRKEIKLPRRAIW